jgi:hypothetical protein
MIRLGHGDLLDSPTLDLATASLALSVVYATENKEKMPATGRRAL